MNRAPEELEKVETEEFAQLAAETRKRSDALERETHRRARTWRAARRWTGSGASRRITRTPYPASRTRAGACS
jgi:peptidoglycan/xylan/chitin deacetylase (PgdA/CDA1 family)